MTFDDLQFEPAEMNGYKGMTAIRAVAEFANGFGLSIITGTAWGLQEGQYEVMGMVGDTICGKVLAGLATYQPSYPAYFEDPERYIDVERVNEVLAEVEAMPSRER